MFEYQGHTSSCGPQLPSGPARLALRWSGKRCVGAQLSPLGLPLALCLIGEPTGGLPNTISFSLEEEEELEGRGSAEFTCFSEDLVAEQLTYMDAQLFKKVVPHHCLGCIWSRRDKKENKHLAPTIRATISQFNTLTKCVVSTILGGKELKTQQRARIIEKWINIAHECRILKNFSSLRAIVSALQSNSIYRLKKAWAAVPK
ncbi:PREDICTED: ral guanine nucleotide dissociation stimulator-like 1 [Galeopterus variegatus]|uniref:Ral guanine nucleotide dissociation stimulator-like 1 n=1 Tax=Galeopterus variegatus TaxID=482537 RepID=A0ABM0Q336_GALVR|nr:PREDICTED: ral guanine nucleotide dissociation stimulator-like 1 [Galeopterus variegatus]